MIYGYTELFCAFFIGLITLMHFIAVFPRKAQLCLSDFAVWTNGAYFSAAPFVTLAYGGMVIQDEMGSYILPLYGAYLLYIFGLMLSKPLFGGLLQRTVREVGGDTRYPLRWATESMDRIFPIWIRFLMVTVIALRLAEFRMGGGASAMDSAEIVENMSYPFIVADNLVHAVYPAVLIYTIYAIFVLIRNWTDLLFVWLQDWRYLLHIMRLTTLVVLTLLVGRRELIFFLFVAVFLIMVINKSVRWKVGMSGLIVVGAAVLNFLVFPVFLSVRNTITEYRENDTRLTNPYTLAIEALMNRGADTVSAEDREEYKRNVADRMLQSRDFVLEILQMEGSHSTMGGAALMNSILYAVPRVLRGHDVFGSTKGDIEEKMGLAGGDAATTMATFFIADFGVIGGLLGGVFFAVICDAYWWLILRCMRRYTFISVTLLAGMIYFIYNIEAELSLTFCALRNLLIIAAVLFLVCQVVPMQRNELQQRRPPAGPRPRSRSQPVGAPRPVPARPRPMR